MKPSLTKNNPYAPYLLLLIQPIFMATNTIVARGGVESVPPISLAFWRWFTVFIILFPFFFNEILKSKKEFNKEFFKKSKQGVSYWSYIRPFHTLDMHCLSTLRTIKINFVNPVCI